MRSDKLFPCWRQVTAPKAPAQCKTTCTFLHTPSPSNKAGGAQPWSVPKLPRPRVPLCGFPSRASLRPLPIQHHPHAVPPEPERPAASTGHQEPPRPPGPLWVGSNSLQHFGGGQMTQFQDMQNTQSQRTMCPCTCTSDRLVTVDYAGWIKFRVHVSSTHYLGTSSRLFFPTALPWLNTASHLSVCNSSKCPDGSRNFHTAKTSSNPVNPSIHPQRQFGCWKRFRHDTVHLTDLCTGTATERICNESA